MIVGLIGAGNMGGALARGWHAGEGGPTELLIADADRDKAVALAAAAAGTVVDANREAAERADVVVLAVKPNLLGKVAADIVSGKTRALVSILAGTTLAQLEAALPGVPLLRVMPNVAAEVRHGLFCYTAGPGMEGELRSDVLALFEALGTIVEMDESLFEQATVLMGCGPAFIALVHEALVDAGVAEGLSDPVARKLVTGTLRGTAALLDANLGDSIEVRRRVTSPGGLTEVGVAVLESGEIRSVFGSAVKSAVLKAAQMQ